MRIHIVGIGGAGMKGIAEIAQECGHEVTGTDIALNNNVTSLASSGITIFNEHRAQNIENANVISISSAIDNHNPEIVNGMENKIPIWGRMQTLDRLVDNLGKRIAVIGSCGKTSTTAILEGVFSACMDPTVYMGAISKRTGKNGHVGDGRVIIAESCEYKGAFYDFKADYILLTDVVQNHEDYFGEGIDMTIRSFANYIETSSAKKVFVPSDVAELALFKQYKFGAKVVTYGSHGDWKAVVEKKDVFETTFGVYKHNKYVGQFKLKLLGIHNIYHSLPSIALALEFGLNVEEIKKGLSNIDLPNRRFEVKYQNSKYIGIDDNARIPSQINLTLSIIRDYLPNYKIIVMLGVWGRINARPIEKYAEVLKEADTVIILGLGDAAESKGGAECEDADEKLKKQLLGLGVQAINGLDENDVSSLVYKENEKYPVAFLTLGYDKYSRLFDSIHNQITMIIKNC